MIECAVASTPSWRAALALPLRLWGNEGQGLEPAFCWLSPSGACCGGANRITEHSGMQRVSQLEHAAGFKVRPVILLKSSWELTKGMNN